MEEFWNVIKSYLFTYGIRLLIAIAVYFIGSKLIKFIIKRTNERKTIKKIDESAATFVRSFISIGLKCLLIVIVIGILGIPMTSVITILGTASLAIGLALQGSLANFAGGFMILVFRPFKVGDYIDNHSDSGTVTSIGVFYTTLETPDKITITVPNGSLANATVVNYSLSESRRVDFDISISYDSDIDKAKDLLISLASNNDKSLSTPAPFVAVKEHGNSAIILTLRVWCKSSDYWNLRFELLEQVKKAFDMTGIEIPYNTINVIKK